MELPLQHRSSGALRRVSGTAAVLGLVILAGASSASATSARFATGLARPALESPEAPTVTNLVPATGPIGGGTPVRIDGHNFTGATEVDFGATPATFSMTATDRIEAIAPDEGEGTVDVTVTTPEGTSAVSRAAHYSYVPPGPFVVEVVADEGQVAGGRPVKVLGAHFEGVSEVSFGGSAAAFEVVSPEEIDVVTPPGPAPKVDVRVTTSEGVSPIRPADKYTYLSKSIQISKVSPVKGPAAGGNEVGILGEEFYGVTGVKFGGVSSPGFSVSPVSITAVAPPHTVDKVVVQVDSTFGVSELEWCVRRGNKGGSCSIHDYYKFLDPTVTGITPGSGPLAGGTPVTITGTGFAVGETDTHFTINKVAATDVDCTSISTCTAVTPPGTKAGRAGAVIVSVSTNQTASSKKNPAVEFLYE